MKNAYEIGYSDGLSDFENNDTLNGAELVCWFDAHVAGGVFRNHEKIQYLTGYRRGATGQTK